MTTRSYIEGIGSYVPAERIDNYQRAQSLGYARDFIDEKVGSALLARKGDGEDTSDLACEAVRDLVSGGLDLGAVGGVIVCTQNPDGFGIPHVSAIVQGKLGIPKSAAAFDISLGCSGYVYGLAIADAFMNAQGLDNVLLVTSDPYSKIVAPGDSDTAMIFGDAATATWLRRSGDRSGMLEIGPAVFGTDGASGHHLTVADNRRLTMNGREVFNFTATAVPQQILALLDKCGLTREAVDYYLLHQGSKYIVDTISRRLKIEKTKVPLGIVGVGNTVSSSIPLMLKEILRDRLANRIVLSGFGVGLSFSSMLLERRPS